MLHTVYRRASIIIVWFPLRNSVNYYSYNYYSTFSLAILHVYILHYSLVLLSYRHKHPKYQHSYIILTVTVDDSQLKCVTCQQSPRWCCTDTQFQLGRLHGLLSNTVHSIRNNDILIHTRTNCVSLGTDLKICDRICKKITI